MPGADLLVGHERSISVCYGHEKDVALCPRIPSGVCTSLGYVPGNPTAHFQARKSVEKCLAGPREGCLSGFVIDSMDIARVVVGSEYARGHLFTMK
jgi:hypothetical protein